MNKKILPLLLICPMMFSSCEYIREYFEPEFVPEEKDDDDNKPKPEAVEFSITGAFFTDANKHLRVNYTCNYESPFDVAGHEFSKLNIGGNIATELDTSHEGYFTLKSPIVNTSLKFEFFDANNTIYISLRYENVTLYDEDNPTPPDIEFPTGYSQLYWSDEFDGDSLKSSNWTHEIGNGDWGWGNGESQYYTDSNDSVSNGVLTITARRQKVDTCDYTSTRIKTQNKVRFTYGYVEAKIALPTTQGMWPAFWMMPNNSVYGGWPNSGEIDIMEARGRLPYVSSSALHFSNSNGHTYLTEEKSGHYIGDYHKYAVEWKEDTIRYFVDDVCYQTINKSQWGTQTAASSETAPFDQDFYIILNLAVGGQFDNWTMPPENFTSASMRVDYVRVFK